MNSTAYRCQMWMKGRVCMYSTCTVVWGQIKGIEWDMVVLDVTRHERPRRPLPPFIFLWFFSFDLLMKTKHLFVAKETEQRTKRRPNCVVDKTWEGGTHQSSSFVFGDPTTRSLCLIERKDRIRISSGCRPSSSIDLNHVSIQTKTLLNLCFKRLLDDVSQPRGLSLFLSFFLSFSPLLFSPLLTLWWVLDSSCIQHSCQR